MITTTEITTYMKTLMETIYENDEKWPNEPEILRNHVLHKLAKNRAKELQYIDNTNELTFKARKHIEHKLLGESNGI